jgi:hypothetical protein
MPYGLPNDPAMIGRWPSPGWFWASRWCTATRLRSVTAVHALLAEVSDVFLRDGHNLGARRRRHYRDYRDRYRAMATSLGFEGHMQWAEEMP